MRKADYTLNVDIKRDDFVVKDVRCKIYLPEKLTDSIELRFFPTPEQSSAIQNPFEFAIEGMIKESDDFVSTRLHANKVYLISSSINSYPSDITEEEIVGNPRDLEIEHLNYSKDSNIQTPKTIGTFWLTPSNLLSPGKTLNPLYTGEISVDLFKKLDFKLANGFQIAFDKHYRYKRANDNLTMFSELVAEFEFEGGKSDIHSNLGYIDDFLVLVSFAERQRCVCLGWDASDSKGDLQHFRRELAIPEPRKSARPNLPLIDEKEFDEFIRVVYDNFIQIQRNDLIREAIYKIIPHTGGNIESDFMSLYSGLETVVLHFRRQNEFEFVFCPDSDEWKELQKDLKKYLKGHRLLREDEDKEKRSLMYNNLNGLNRVSFGTAFEKLIDKYSIKLNDLWPVIDRTEGACLADIRNMLVHGEVFDPTQYQSLMVALEHLRWVVERLILTLLGWDISRSYVKDEFLSTKIEFNKHWKNNRKILSQKQVKV